MHIVVDVHEAAMKAAPIGAARWCPRLPGRIRLVRRNEGRSDRSGELAAAMSERIQAATPQ